MACVDCVTLCYAGVHAASHACLAPRAVCIQVGNCPLHYAAYAGYLELMKLLLSHGADVNAMSVVGSHTPSTCGVGKAVGTHAAMMLVAVGGLFGSVFLLSCSLATHRSEVHAWRVN